ncbi:MAG: hypothetical protein KKH94_13065 [Candidatus Omnitrophica bacterium]|nr:hypothetical protein [Candidatus Omnitrophota bacterium]
MFHIFGFHISADVFFYCITVSLFLSGMAMMLLSKQFIEAFSKILILESGFTKRVLPEIENALTDIIFKLFLKYRLTFGLVVTGISLLLLFTYR